MGDRVIGPSEDQEIKRSPSSRLIADIADIGRSFG
jgi:hypothetical protein